MTSPYGKLEGNSSYVYKLSQMKIPPAPGGGGTLAIVDSRNFPVATIIADAIVTLEPRGLRELHWHPNVVSSFSINLLLRWHVCMDPLILFYRPKSGFISIVVKPAPPCSSAAQPRERLTFMLEIHPYFPITAVRSLQRSTSSRVFSFCFFFSLTSLGAVITSKTLRPPKISSGSRFTRAIAWPISV